MKSINKINIFQRGILQKIAVTFIYLASIAIGIFIGLLDVWCGFDVQRDQVNAKRRGAENHRQSILARWVSGYSNARLEALNGIFQAAKCRARGYRNDETFISIIYLLAAPIQNLLKST